MGETKELTKREAIEKMQAIAKGETTMFCTFSGPEEMNTRPMATLGVDNDGTFWFMSQKDSPKNHEIKENAKVQLIYAVSSKSEYLAVDGTAALIRDQEKIDELWNMFAKTWFTEGRTDPSITLIKVTPKSGYYWDTKHNKMIQLAMIAAGAIVGKTMDDGIQGALKV